MVITSDSGYGGGVGFEPSLFHHLIFFDKKLFSYSVHCPPNSRPPSPDTITHCRSYNFCYVENTSTHQIVPKISLGLMSTILSPQGNNETEQQSVSANSISLFFFRTTRSVKLLLKTRLDKHDFM